MIGKAVTSKSCIGTCLIFNRARQPKDSDAASAVARGGRALVERAEWRDSSTRAKSVSMAVMLRPPSSSPHRQGDR